MKRLKLANCSVFYVYDKASSLLRPDTPYNLR